MKTLILSTVAAVALALSTGAAAAADGAGKTHDDGFDVFLQGQGEVSGTRSFLSGNEDYRYVRPGQGRVAQRRFLSGEATYPIGTDNGFAVYQQDQKLVPHRSFLSGEADYPIGTDNGFAVYLQDLKRRGR